MTAFLARDDYNVIIVDWSNIAKLNYPESAERVKAVGAHIAKMIDFLKSLGNDPNNMSLVGHSLGAHVMGLAGNQATNKVGHVVGLSKKKKKYIFFTIYEELKNLLYFKVNNLISILLIEI